MPTNKKCPSQEEIWKLIESYGIKRDVFEMSQPTEDDLLQLYYFIKKSRRDYRDKETIRRLKEYVQKLKKSHKS
jgi:hypothetical protein